MKQFLPLFLIISLLSIAGIAQPPPPPPGAPASLMINEVDYDQPGVDTAEFIEIYNYGTTSVTMSQVIVALVNGATGIPYDTIFFPEVSLQPNDYYVLCSAGGVVANCNQALADTADNVQNGSPDGIVLFDIIESVVLDAVGYEGDMPTISETAGVPTGMSDNNDDDMMSLSRVPNGVDTDDNSADFELTASTPGEANAQPVGIRTKKKDGFILFPNPVENELNLFLNGIEKGAAITVSNMLGKELRSIRSKGERVKMNTTLLPEGVYFVSVETQVEKTTKRFIKR